MLKKSRYHDYIVGIKKFSDKKNTTYNFVIEQLRGYNKQNVNGRK